MTNISLTYSFWWVFVCLLVGGVYAWIQYTKTATWSNQLNYILAFFRAMLVTFICFFLLEPYVQSITNYHQKPFMIVAVDNSESIKLNSTPKEILKLKSAIKNVKLALIAKGYDVNLLDLETNKIENIDSLKFQYSSTNLSAQLNKINSNYSNFNLSGIVLFTDGIFNEGFSPYTIPFNFPIYTIGVGDTSLIKDIAIKEVIHNSTVFENNSLMLEIQVAASEISHASSEIIISKKGRVILRKAVVLNANQSLVKTLVSIPVSGSGMQSLNIELKPIEDEFTVLNNKETIYFDVIDAKKRILLIASAPHPDLKAIKSTLEQSEYYEVDLAYSLPKKLNYDLLITHQYPTTKTTLIDKETLLLAEVPKWIIIGNSSDSRFLSSGLNLLNSAGSTSKIDLVKPIFNAGFDKFQLDDSFIEWVSDLPPIASPYGLSINNLPRDEFLNQQIGNVVTNRPLLFFTKFKEQRLGVLLGTNIWRWKLDEFRTNQNHTNFTKFIFKNVQYLTSDKRKKRFYVYPQKELYSKGEDVLFYAEEYNTVFERIVGKKVSLSLTQEGGEQNKYSFVPLSENSVFKISNLPQGVYSYAASTVYDNYQKGGEKHYSSGQFVVQELNKETLNPVADFDLLRKIANKTQASFYQLDSINEFKNKIESLSPVSTIHSTQKDNPIINLKWVLIFLISLATAEWFLRKFYGGY